MTKSATVFDRLAADVCRRAFSSPEALAYELGVAPAVCRIVSPVMTDRLDRSSVLDVGCGGGRLSVEIARVVKRLVVGIDLSPSQVRRLARRSRVSGAAVAVRASAEHLPFPAGSFGGVISSCALKHWADPGRGVRECVRVARSGGVVVIVEIDGAATVQEMRAFARMTRLPPGVREAYVRFAMRTVVGVALARDGLLDLLSRAEMTPPVSVQKLDGSPFLIAQGHAC